MKQELKVKEQTLPTQYDPALLAEMEACEGAAGDVTTEDIVFPTISIQQTSSDLVKKDIARSGAIYNIQKKQELGYKDKPMRFIPLKFTKIITCKRGQDVVSREIWTPSRDIDYNRASKDGVSEYLTYVFWIITEKDLLEGKPFAGRFTFISKSMKVGRKLASDLYNLKQNGLKSWDQFFEMTTVLVTEGKNSWYVPEVVQSIPTNLDQKVQAFQWFRTIDKLEKNKKLDNLAKMDEEDHVVVEAINPDTDAEDVCTNF